jgi:hypothetical protein
LIIGLSNGMTPFPDDLYGVSMVHDFDWIGNISANQIAIIFKCHKLLSV